MRFSIISTIVIMVDDVNMIDMVNGSSTVFRKDMIVRAYAIVAVRWK